MKRTSALLLSALLALSVTGCGSYKQNDLTNGTGSTTTTGTTTTGNTTTGTTTGTGTTSSTTMTGTNGNASTSTGTPGISNSTANTTTGGSTSGTATNQRTIVKGATFGQMLRNARVNDKDGNLWDYENPVTRGNAY